MKKRILEQLNEKVNNKFEQHNILIRSFGFFDKTKAEVLTIIIFDEKKRTFHHADIILDVNITLENNKDVEEMTEIIESQVNKFITNMT